MIAVVLAGTGVFVYLQFQHEAETTVDAGLSSRADELAAVVRQEETNLAGPEAHLVGRTDSFAEVLDPSGTVVDSSPVIGDADLLDPEQLGAAAQAPTFVSRGPLPGLSGGSRLLAVPVATPAGKRIVVVGTSTEDRDDATEDLLQLLLVALPAALILASVAGYFLAAAALRPVEAMRARAAEISTAAPEERLPVPATRDEVARLGETLNEMLARIGDAMARERAFVADAGHELRTPLAILRAELDLALAEGRSPDELRAALASAAEETDRLTQLSEDLLTIAQTEGGRLPLRREQLRLAAVFQPVERRFSRRAAEAGRAIEVGDGGELELRGDLLRLDQAVGTLVDNALRYGGGTIALTARRAGDAVEIHVTDDGPGFPPDFLDRAFERFTRAPGAREGGSGLGLAIVATVADAHGGSAHAANRPEGGADVWLVIPLSSDVNQGA
ncbi:MAG TPA: HAMP domain-containing sensor histidine kinase [Solirubrobacterales bacterium]|nr:HAMP domain-containing sensor histidine kinase [Solirubrobacterales bacterium]